MALHYFHPFKSFLALFGPVLARFGPFLIQFQAKTPIFALLVEIFLGSNFELQSGGLSAKGGGGSAPIPPLFGKQIQSTEGGRGPPWRKKSGKE